MIFTTCAEGHDLTVAGAFIYKSNGQRECRECNPKTKSRKQKQRTLGTWSEKRGDTRNTFA